jgi:hypothetical protein
MSKAAEYRAKAAGHSKLAESCLSEEARETHVGMAAWFLALADDVWLEPGNALDASRAMKWRIGWRTLVARTICARLFRPWMP